MGETPTESTQRAATARSTSPVVAGRGDAAPCDSFEDIYARRGLLVRLAYRFCWNIEDAEDAVQSALATATRKADQLADRGKLWSWIRAIVVRQCHDLRRRRRRDPDPELLAQERPVTASTPALGDTELAGLMRTLIPALPEKQQTAIVLRHLENMEYTAIAEVMGVSASTVRVHVRNAREALRKEIVRRHPEWAPTGDRE